MSSILDALNKLEGEKERERAQQTLEPAEIDPELAAEALIEPDALRDSVTLNIRPVTLIAGAVSLLILIVVIVAITVSVMVDSAPQQMATADPPTTSISPPQPESTPPAMAETVVESSTEVVAAIPEEVPIAAISEETTAPEPAPVKQSDPTPVSTPVEPVALEATPEPVLPEPIEVEPLVVAKVAAPESKTDVAPQAQPETKIPEAEVLNIQALPRFTVALQRKHGLDDFKINMINPVSDTNPYGNAIINREKVFENSYIGGNQVLLKKVEKEGISVEVVRTGEFFFHGF
ncbi:MAG: hypothetical protein VCD00_07400 [Candidatus Hydrogenedentota bacterium]